MGNIKQYTLDTNVFRYQTEINNDQTDLNYGSRIFWRKVKDEIENNEAVLLIPKEVINELSVQSHTLKAVQNKKIDELVNLCIEVEPERLTQEIEHSIRQMEAFIRANFRDDLGRNKVGYGGISDARILYTAYCEESILVTANIRDFLLYPLLFPQDEDRLFDLKENDYIKIPSQGYNKIHEDSRFKKLLNEFYSLDKSN